jgi:hypothetical protein
MLSSSDGKRGHSFKLSQGQGSLQLKCEQDLRGMGWSALFDVRFSIASGAPTEKIVRHNFAQSAACISHDWDFSQLAKDSSKAVTFTVSITPAP